MQITQVSTAGLIPYARNARQHSETQVQQIAASIKEFGFNAPILVDGEQGIIAGHGRLAAAQLLGLEQVPVIELHHLSEEQKRAYILADNRIALNSTWDSEMLAIELADLQACGLAELTGFDLDEFGDALLAANPEAGEPEAEEVERSTLVEQFGAPPFSVLDTRRDYWKQRRDQWLTLTGNLTETKEGVLAGGDANIMAGINEGSSNFDPVLAELMMRWFAPKGGKILDPFGGEQTKGVVAGELGFEYHACEFRQEQVDVNRKACASYPQVHYSCGDSRFIDERISERGFDLCFTSPPYYDLEVYSKEDMSALGTYAEFMDFYRTIFEKCVAMLADNAFLIVKICEIRDKKTGIYRNFVGDNISLFTDLGLHYYNEITLINAFGTAPQRAGRYFATRKMVKVHQNVLVFVKGSVQELAKNLERWNDEAIAFPE